jgi:hypothetical protein
MLEHAYSRPAARDLNRLGTQARKDICTIVPILTREMVEEACTDQKKVSDSARILREAGVSEIGKDTYHINTDETVSLVCRFQKDLCAILSINQRSTDSVYLENIQNLGEQVS